MIPLYSIRFYSFIAALVFWSLLRPVLCQYVNTTVVADIDGWQDNGDLHTFITVSWPSHSTVASMMTLRQRPDIRSPKLNVTIHLPDELASGYLFLAPYDCLECQYAADVFVPQQIGPHIYDRYGVCR